MSEATINEPRQNPTGPVRPEVHVHNTVSLGGNRGWNILMTLMAVAGLTVIGYQFSLGPFAEVVATGMTMFLVTLVSYMFKAGILRLPEKQGDGDLVFTRSTLRRIYDELTAAVVKSSLFRLVLFAAAYTVGFLLLRTGIASGLSLMTSMWMAIGVGLLLGSLVVAQDQILSWVRTLQAKKNSGR